MAEQQHTVQSIQRPEQVSFSLRRTASTLYPITAMQQATRQVHAEQVVQELAVAGEPEAITFDYRTERYAGGLDVVLVIQGTDELRVREAAQMLDARYHCGQGFYEEQLEDQA